jgi:hypothetical protein
MKKKILIVFVVIAVLTGIRLIGFEREGVTYDEPVYVKAGREYMSALSKLDFSKESWSFNKEHPPVTKYVYGTSEVFRLIFDKFTSWESNINNIYTFPRLMSVLLGSATLLYTFLIARFFLNFWLSLLAMIVLGLNPLFIAHTRLAGHESVSLFFVSGMWYWYLLYNNTKSKLHFAIMNLHGILAFGTRFNNVLAMFPIWIWEAVSWIKSLANNKNIFHKIPWKIIWLPASLWIGVFLIFPYWWNNPIESIQSTINHWGGDPKEVFFGEIRTTPWTYYIVYFMSQTPIILIILGLFQVFNILFSKSKWKAKNLFLIAVFAIWFLWSLSTIKQGGMRYLLPLYIPFSILAVISLGQIFNKFRTVLITSASILIIYLGVQLKLTHPFYLDYYNELTGGSSRVFNNNILPIGFWGQGTLEVIKSLDKWVNTGESVGFYTILMPEHLLTAFLPEGVNGVYKIDKNALFQSNWILQQSIFKDNSEPIPDYYELIHTFYGAGDAPLFYLYKK